MNTIEIDIGVYTQLEVDLTHFVFTGISKVIMTIRNMYSDEIVLVREFTTAEKHIITITPEESRKIGYDAEYDFDILLESGMRLKNGDNGRIILRRGAGECNQSQ